MRIGIITPNPVSELGGVERFTASLAQWLTSMGFGVTIFDRTSLSDARLRRPARGKLHELRQLRALRQVVCSSEPCDLYLANGLAAIARRPGFPAIMVFHGCYYGYFDSLRRLQPFWRRWLNSWWFTHWEKCAARGAHIVAVSRGVAEILRRHYRLARVAVIENGIDLAHFHRSDRLVARRHLGLPAGAFLGIYTGRMHDAGKRTTLLWDLAKRLRGDEGIIMASPYEADRVHVQGVYPFHDVSYERMPLVLSAADCLLLPSTFEGCSYSVIESMACGLPPLITRVGHAESIAQFHPTLARCVLDDDPQQMLLERFRELREDKAWCSEASRQAIRYTEQFNSITTMGNAYVSLFNQVLHHG